ncbi:MAG: bifunctional glutamate N-acetyltransferase/amino-acid acetyltransferase ArgJ [Sedimentisphaerales bacterium]|nr:bifunctional glutamate N-acetyltransferase/amino-acid acetyltransferase ArgJ [Sedimentisphaerales bacterium]
MPNRTLTAPLGFRVAAVKAGLKASGNLDLGLIVSDVPCRGAAVFSTNKIVSPTIIVNREHVRAGRVQAVFVNAGNANSCTGTRGLRDVHSICRQISKALRINPSQVLVNSTGIIGEYLPMSKVRTGIEMALSGLSRSAGAGKDLSRAIMTTDTRPKSACRNIKISGKTIQIAGICKGSGMIAPNMATMLGFITTDADITSALLRRALREAVAVTFNKVSVDNHNSTNDGVIVMASGLADNRSISKPSDSYKVFARALWEVCDDLARQIAADGEGATCAVTVRVTGAATPAQAHNAVRAIVDSPLVRTAFHGADPNWGRIISAVGYSRVKFHPEKLSCKIAGTSVYRHGRPCPFDHKKLSRKMKAKEWYVEVNLGAGRYWDFCYTCDLSREYVTINADYHT